MFEPLRPATADILHLMKARALTNLWSTSADDAFFVVTVLVIAVGALLLVNELVLRRSLSWRHLTLPSFFMTMYVGLMSLPSVVWFYASPQNPVRYTFFLSMQSFLVTFPIGVLLANLLFGRPSNPPQVARFFGGALRPSGDDRAALRVWIAFMALAAIVTVVYLSTSSYVPLIGALTSYGAAAPAAVRRAIVHEGMIIHYAHALTARLFLPFCLVYAHFMAYLYRGWWRLLFWPTLAVVGFVSSLTFDRMFPFSVLLFLALAVYFKYDDQGASGGGRRLFTPRLALYVAGLLLLGMLVGGIVSLTQFNKPMSLDIIRVTATDFLFNRVMLDPSYMAYIYFEIFDDPATLLYGRALHVLVSQALGLEFYALISPSFVASLWVNFGWTGVLLGGALIGFLLQLIQVAVFDRKTVPALTCFILMLLNGAWIIYGHLLATMVFSVYAPCILIVVLLRRRRHLVSKPSRPPTPLEAVASH